MKYGFKLELKDATGEFKEIKNATNLSLTKSLDTLYDTLKFTLLQKTFPLSHINGDKSVRLTLLLGDKKEITHYEISEILSVDRELKDIICKGIGYELEKQNISSLEAIKVGDGYLDPFVKDGFKSEVLSGYLKQNLVNFSRKGEEFIIYDRFMPSDKSVAIFDDENIINLSISKKQGKPIRFLDINFIDSKDEIVYSVPSLMVVENATEELITLAKSQNLSQQVNPNLSIKVFYNSPTGKLPQWRYDGLDVYMRYLFLSGLGNFLSNYDLQDPQAKIQFEMSKFQYLGGDYFLTKDDTKALGVDDSYVGKNLKEFYQESYYEMYKKDIPASFKDDAVLERWELENDSFIRVSGAIKDIYVASFDDEEFNDFTFKENVILFNAPLSGKFEVVYKTNVLEINASHLIGRYLATFKKNKFFSVSLDDLEIKFDAPGFYGDKDIVFILGKRRDDGSQLNNGYYSRIRVMPHISDEELKIENIAKTFQNKAQSDFYMNAFFKLNAVDDLGIDPSPSQFDPGKLLYESAIGYTFTNLLFEDGGKTSTHPWYPFDFISPASPKNMLVFNKLGNAYIQLPLYNGLILPYELEAYVQVVEWKNDNYNYKRFLIKLKMFDGAFSKSISRVGENSDELGEFMTKFRKWNEGIDDFYAPKQ